jgi:hypothetical protein
MLHLYENKTIHFIFTCIQRKILFNAILPVDSINIYALLSNQIDSAFFSLFMIRFNWIAVVSVLPVFSPW